MKTISKRNISIILTFMLIAGMLTGCGKANNKSDSESIISTEKTPTDNTSTEKVGDKGGKSIVIWTKMENEVDLLQEYGDKWGEETGNTVKVIVQEPDIQQFSQAAKSADGPDGMFGIPNDRLADFVSANLAAEVPAEVYSDNAYVEAAVEASYIDGVRYAVPISVETPFLFYNTDKISEVPATWEEMIEVSKDLGGIVYEATGVYYNLGFLRAYGSYIFKYENAAYDVEDIGLGNQDAVKAYEFISAMAKDYNFFSSDVSYDLAKSSFQNGESAFYIGGVWDVEGFTAAGTPFLVSTLPTLNGNDFVTPVGTYVGFVSSKSQNQDVVFDFYKYLAENASEAIYNVGNRIPARLEAQEAIEKDDITQVHIDQIAMGEPLPTVSEMGVIWQPFQDNMKLLFEGRVTAQEAADYILEQVQEGIDLMHSGQ